MYRVEVSNVNKTSFNVSARNGSFIIDSAGKSIAPLEALLSGIGGCVGVYLNRFFEVNKVSVNYVIILEAELTKVPPIFFQEINIIIDLKGLLLDERKINQMMNVVKKCPAHNTLKYNPNINFKVI